MAEYTQVVMITLANGERAEFSGPIQIRPGDQLLLVQWENRATKTPSNNAFEEKCFCGAETYGKSGLCFDHLLANVGCHSRKNHRRAAGATKD